MIGRLLRRRPVAAFLTGLGSHLILDAMPHWGCDSRQPEGAAQFLTAAKRDGLLGLATMASATVVVDRQARLATVMAITGAVLFDIDKPLGHFFGVNPFPAAIQRLHNLVQNESPEGMPDEIRFGFACAALDLVIIAMGRREALVDRVTP